MDGLAEASVKELRIVTTGPPSPFPNPGSHHCGFVEVENEDGKSISVGTWREREDGLWELVVDMSTIC